MKPEGFSDAHWAFVIDTLTHIVDEAIKTRPTGMSQQTAVDILIGDRVDRHILNVKEARALRAYLWDKREDDNGAA